MADTVSATYELKLAVAHTLDLALDNVTNPSVPHNIGTLSGTLDASSDTPASLVFSDTINLAASVATINLTQMNGAYGQTDMTFSGKKVQAVFAKCSTSNTSAIKIAIGAASGYNLFGEDNASSEEVEIMPGGGVLMLHADNTEDVDATHTIVDLSGGGTEEISICIVAG